MARYRDALPQLGGGLFLTDGGIETTLIFNEGLELPDFAAFDLLRRPGGRQALGRYFRTYSDMAQRFEAGLVLESATWRANPDWAARQGYGRHELAEANRAAIELLADIRAELPRGMAAVISGCVGPRGDGYKPDTLMSAEEARDYHQEQIDTFRDTAADMVSAITMNYVDEASGVALAARRAEMPAAISFTVETDGRLPTGQPLDDAIAEVDAKTRAYPAYYMLNCAHPAHFEAVLAPGGAWTRRIRGLRANASRKSHAELNESAELDTGNPVELGLQYAMLKKRSLSAMNVLGGCCGTDHRHVEQIARACAPLFR